MEILEGKIPFGIFWSYTECPYKAYQELLRPIRIDTAAKTKGIAFHKFAHVYHRDNDQPPDIEYKDEDQQAFHEFEKKRWEYCQAEGIPWKAKLTEKEIGNNFFTTLIDRLDDNGDEEYEVKELNDEGKMVKVKKTKRTYTLVEYKKQHYKSKDIPQMSYGTILLLDMYDVEVSNWAIYYTEGDMYYGKPSKRSMNSMRRKMSLAKASMKAGFFPAKPGWYCNMCPYANAGCDYQGIKNLVCASCGEKDGTLGHVPNVSDVPKENE